MIQFMLEAVKNRITQSVINSVLQKAGACEVVDGGKPTVSYQGLVFFGVHGGSIENLGTQGGYYLRERYDFNVTITIKTARTPKYRIGDVEFDSGESGLYAMNDLLKGAINGYLDLATDATALMQAVDKFSDSQPFVWGIQPRYLRSEDPVGRTASWFGATLDDKGNTAGYSIRSQFSGLEMIRSIPNIQPV